MNRLKLFCTLACTWLLAASIAVAEPSLQSDKSDYAPGSTATLTGAGFQSNEAVTLQVLHADSTPATGADHEPWTVTAGDDGGFVTTWHVCEDDCVGSTVRATATGASGASAFVEFTDGPPCTPTSATCPDCVPSLKSGNVPTLTTTAPTVDGVKNDFTGEWSASDLWTHMYTAGSDCKPILSEAYVKYVCHGATATVYVFVECLSGNFIQVDPSNDGGNNWIKLDCGTAGCVTAGGKFVDSSDQPTTSAAHACSNGHFAYVGQSGNLATGYEASFTIPANATYSIAVHAEVQIGTDPTGNTSAGPNGPQGGICMSLPCDNTCTPCTLTCPGTKTVECGGSTEPSATGTPTGCANPTYTDDTVDGTNCAVDHIVKTITRHWTADDGCGGTSTCDQTIIVKDTTKPVITCPADIGYQCYSEVPAATDADASATDDCSSVTVKFTGQTESNPGSSCNNVIKRTYEATDACGNSASCTQTITVNDNTAPVLDGCPADASFQCVSEVPAAATVTASDNCDGDVAVTPSETQSGTGCKSDPLIIVRTWSAKDKCGNEASCKQTITVVDDTAPVPPADPAPASYQCASDVPAPGQLTAKDNCDGDITVTGIDSNNGGKGCASDPLVITRTWTFTDKCGNSSSASQKITVIDDTKPVITKCAADVTANGGGLCCVNVDLGTPTATDNCSKVSFSNDATQPFCVGTTTVTWKATDACGNSATCTQTVTVKGQICATKFYDTNANGVKDGSEVGVAGWKFVVNPGNLTGTTGPNGTVCFDVPAGSYSVSEATPLQDNWVATTPKSANVTIDKDHCTVSASFGNYCFKAPSNGLTLGFWTNKNGQAILEKNAATHAAWVTLLNNPCGSGAVLRNANGTIHTFSTYTDLKNWLTNATSTNMSYMLSAQLATNLLDEAFNNLIGSTGVVVPGGVKTLANVCIVPFLSVTQPITCGNPALVSLTTIPGSTACGCNSNNGLVTIDALQASACCLLGAYGNTTLTSTQRTYQECVKDILDMINNNGNPTGISAYPCGGVSQYINPPGTCPATF